MADHLTPEKRSWNMSRIRSKDTSIEKKVRSYLFAYGFRYRKNVAKLPGKPDIVLPKYRIAIFVHGCFWHRHPGCKYSTIPTTNTDFWYQKLSRNVENDQTHYKDLLSMGWRVSVVWGCELKKNFEKRMEDLVAEILEGVNDEQFLLKSFSEYKK